MSVRYHDLSPQQASKVRMMALNEESLQRAALAAALRFCGRCRRQFDSRAGGCPVCAAFAARVAPTTLFVARVR